MKRKNIEKAVEEIEGLLSVANKHCENAACGFDEGWYSGEGNAYETVLEILKKAIEA